MKKLRKSTLLLFAVTVFAYSCHSDIDDPNPNSEVKETIITASVGIDTKIGFEDKAAEGVKLTWSTSDQFMLYDSDGKYAATLTLTGGEGTTKGTFSTTDPLQYGKNYTAVYPAMYGTDSKPLPTLGQRGEVINGLTQINDGTNATHLDDMCYMKGSYNSIDDTGDIVFTHQYALLTVKIGLPSDYTPTDGVPTSLTFFNGTQTNVLKLSLAAWVSDITAYVMINPYVHSGEARKLRFDVVTSAGKVFQSSYTSDKSYQAGKRYTADLTSVNKPVRIDGYTLEYFATNEIPEGISTLVITDGGIPDFSVLNTKLRALSADRRIDLVLPAVTSVLGYSFQNNTALSSVSLPVATSIGVAAFFGCSALFSVSLPSLITIENYGFTLCTSLTSVSFPVATTIKDNAFNYCSVLSSVSLPVATSIGHSAFSTCISLASVNFPMATSIGMTAFSNCYNLATINFPVATTIGNSAFSSCSALSSVSLPMVATVEESAFDRCSSLASISLPLLEEVKWGTFSNCTALVTVDLPKAISIRERAFQESPALATVNLPEATSIGEFAFYRCHTGLISVDFPKVTTIGTSTFHGCTALSSVTLPKLTNIGNQAFSDCIALATLEIGTKSGSRLDGVGIMLFNYTNQESQYVLMDLSNVSLTLGTKEYNANVVGNAWRSTMTGFKEIIKKDND